MEPPSTLTPGARQTRFVSDDAQGDSVAWEGHMREAITLALSQDVARSANPRVGCVIVDIDGQVVGRGYHRGAGTAHAEVAALADAGGRGRGGTAVVTLEPCRHTGRTGPCTQALIDAGIRRVVYSRPDPTAEAQGGGQVLRTAGLDVVTGVCEEEASRANRAWEHVQVHGRPLMTLKCAMSLDGRVADSSRGPTAVSGAASHARAQALRATVDAIVVGTGTALVDDPQLTARTGDGVPLARQPLRVVMGERDLPPGARVLDGSAQTLLVREHSVGALVDALMAADVQHCLVEGGPMLAASLLDAGLIDEIVWFVAPVLFGAGPIALPALAHDRRVTVRRVEMMEDDVLVEGDLSHVHRDR